MANPVDVTIVVPTRNEERNLPRLLASISKQEGVSYEVIVVDQESEDRTVSISKSFGASVINREKPPFYSPPAQSRNVGAAQANGEYLLHLDADMELPDSRTLARATALFDDAHQAVVIHEKDVAEGWWNKVKGLERLCYWNSPLESARGSKRELFESVGGYDPAVSSGEDMLIHQRFATATAIAASDDVWLLHHTGRISLRRLLKKKYSYGRTASAYLERAHAQAPKSTQNWAKAALVSYFKNLKLARKQPIQFMAIFPLRAAELAAVRLGMRKGN